MAVTINGTTGVSVGTGSVTFPDSSTQTTAATGFGFKNRIINGAMMIDQRNAGAAVTVNSASNTFLVDRWFANAESADGVFTGQQVSTAPEGFNNSLKFTVTTADASIGASQLYIFRQRIEGYNFADLGWGTANAKAITISFWVQSSVTGLFGGALFNNAGDRAYAFSFSISSANTWEQKTITVAGDTTGTWLTTNGTALNLVFSLGIGSTYKGTAGSWGSTLYLAPTGSENLIATNGATFYITGVQLEKGSTATSFDYRPYSTELALCQRYYYRLSASSSGQICAAGYNNSTTITNSVTWFPVPMRTVPSALEQSGTASHYAVRYLQSEVACSSVPTFATASFIGAETSFILSSGLTAGQGSLARFNSSSGYLGWSAEL